VSAHIARFIDLISFIFMILFAPSLGLVPGGEG
jgi:hypothetical protein